MGCFSSKPETTTHKPMEPPLPTTKTPIQTPQPAPHKLPPQPIISVPRPTVTYGERERNELKVKNLRDKLETTINTSEQVLQDEARLAVRLHREGKKASARILIRRRQLTHKKISNCQTMLFTVMEMIDSMDLARDNAKFIQSVESGTKAINDIMKDMSVESVHQALDDARQAEAYTKEIGEAMEGEVDTMDDDQFEDTVAEMIQKYGAPEEEPLAHMVPERPTVEDQIAAIPQPPTEQPLPPPTPEPVDEIVEDAVPVAL